MNTSAATFPVPASIGHLPKRTDTVIASVLAAFLDGEKLTSLDCVYLHSTTRLAAVVFDIESKYGWTISRVERTVPTNDGRLSTITVYFLLPAIIQQAITQGAMPWVSQVKANRAKLYLQVKPKRPKAAKAPQGVRDPRQMDLWE